MGFIDYVALAILCFLNIYDFFLITRLRYKVSSIEKTLYDNGIDNYKD